MTGRARDRCGTNARYVLEKCRCEPCREAKRRYTKDLRARREAAGGSVMVPIGPVRAHLRALSRQGVGYKSVARLVGCSSSNLYKIHRI